ncbi:hypothetical protein HPB52_003129 [Rhipicephalus sanguineus]|uniref:HTH psq-type domain-containing protein n=1 Tax=Rhipicephalus sanguineus TaxID=34632 RepID=A0A9D4PPH4_RHISA|nr:hypothetical protein HPB52_003129 [Rhipicephalus sanguineus]
MVPAPTRPCGQVLASKASFTNRNTESTIHEYLINSSTSFAIFLGDSTMPIAGAGAKKKRKQFSLQEKVDLFKEIDAGKKQIDLCRERGIAPSTLTTILKDREKVLKLHRESQLAPTRKRLRLGNF